MKHSSSLAPSFRSRLENILFLFIVLFVISSPIYTHYLIKREEMYKAIPKKFGAYQYMADEIFSKNNDIDVLFLGSSDMWKSYNPKVLKSKWKEYDGKDYNIIMFAANWRGYDKLYFMLKDLLSQRKVKLVLLSIYGRNNDPHLVSKYLWNFYDHWEDFSHLSFGDKVRFYAESIIGCPRQLLTLLGQDRIDPKHYNTKIPDDFGALITDSGFDPQVEGSPIKPFKERTDNPPKMALSDVLYLGKGKIDRHFAPPHKMNKFEIYFYNLIVQLCNQNNVKLALIQTPFPKNKPEKVELFQWSFDKDIPTIGFQLIKLFPGMSKEDIQDFYSNNTHMNSNGARYLTETISEIIYNVYKD